MLTPLTLEYTHYLNRPVVIATYAAQEHDVLDGNADAIGQTLYMGFYGSDLTDMAHLFYPGDRYAYPNREEVFGEIDQNGF